MIRARRRHGELCMLAHQRAGLDGRDAALQFGTPSAESHLGAELMGVAPANARLSMVRCLPSDAMTLVRDSAFLCATASRCTRWPVACRHLLIVSEFMLSDCLAEVHESRSWTVLPSMSSSSVSGGSVAGLLRDMRHRDRLREEGWEGKGAHSCRHWKDLHPRVDASDSAGARFQWTNVINGSAVFVITTATM